MNKKNNVCGNKTVIVLIIIEIIKILIITTMIIIVITIINNSNLLDIMNMMYNWEERNAIWHEKPKKT